jgi:hypothetical protein
MRGGRRRSPLQFWKSTPAHMKLEASPMLPTEWQRCYESLGLWGPAHPSRRDFRERLDMVQGGPSSMYSRIQLRPTIGSTRPKSLVAESHDGRVSPTGYTQQPPWLHYSRDWKLPTRKFDGKEVRKVLGTNINRYILTLQEDTAAQSRKTGEVWTNEWRKDLFVRGLEDVALAFSVLPLIRDREVGYEELCHLFRECFQSKLHDDWLYKLMNVPKKREETFTEYLTYIRDVERNTSRDDGDMLLQCFSQGASKEFKSLLLMEAENCRKRVVLSYSSICILREKFRPQPSVVSRIGTRSWNQHSANCN